MRRGPYVRYRPEADTYPAPVIFPNAPLSKVPPAASSTFQRRKKSFLSSWLPNEQPLAQSVTFIFLKAWNRAVNSQTEARFQRHLFAAVEQAKEFGYRPNRFVGMIHSKGAFKTVKEIVASGRASEGFDKLVFEGRTDLTCEAIIVETEWRVHFDADLLEIAERRLAAYGYSFTRNVGEAVESPLEPTNPLDSVISSEDTDPKNDTFEPPSNDGREIAQRMIHERPGQARFRETLISAYGVRCCISGPAIAEALEAAHICAYRGDASDHVQNGLLMRADLHKLFDKYCFGIEPETLRVRLSRSLTGNHPYRELDGVRLVFPDARMRPSKKALEVHWKTFNERENE